MAIDERLERLYQRVELVKGAGDPRTRKLCVMSFVAFLAGEGHSDRPGAASPLVRELAVTVNDAMPAAMRQELKPFVPRIIGTNDGRDAERAAMLRRATDAEILPRVCADFLAPRGLRGWWRASEFHGLRSRLLELTHAPTKDADHAKLGAAVAGLLCHCAAEAPDAASRTWYWEKAIDLLDRACDIRGAEPSARIDEARLHRLEKLPVRGEGPGRRRAMADRAFACLRSFLG